MNEITNTVEVIGRLTDMLYASHVNHGEVFYAGTIAVKRLSDVEDILPIIVPGRIIDQVHKLFDKCVRVTGQFRSHNKIVDGKARLLVNIFVQSIEEAQESTTNSIQLTGRLCKPPIYRITPFGRTICDVIIAVDRGNGIQDFIPCIAWGRNADRAASLNTSDKISISGRIQSRCYEKMLGDGTSVTRTAYEVSIFTLDKEAAA